MLMPNIGRSVPCNDRKSRLTAANHDLSRLCVSDSLALKRTLKFACPIPFAIPIVWPLNATWMPFQFSTLGSWNLPNIWWVLIFAEIYFWLTLLSSRSMNLWNGARFALLWSAYRVTFLSIQVSCWPFIGGCSRCSTYQPCSSTLISCYKRYKSECQWPCLDYLPCDYLTFPQVSCVLTPYYSDQPPTGPCIYNAFRQADLDGVGRESMPLIPIIFLHEYSEILFRKWSKNTKIYGTSC